MDEALIAALEMLGQGPKTAIITLGPKGCVVGTRNGDKDEIQHVPVPQVTAADTTVCWRFRFRDIIGFQGAGDCFCGSLAYYLVEMPDLPIVEAVRRSAAIAAKSVTRKGTQSSYFRRDELEPELFQD